MSPELLALRDQYEKNRRESARLTEQIDSETDPKKAVKLIEDRSKSDGLAAWSRGQIVTMAEAEKLALDDDLKTAIKKQAEEKTAGIKAENQAFQALWPAAVSEIRAILDRHPWLRDCLRVELITSADRIESDKTAGIPRQPSVAQVAELNRQKSTYDVLLSRLDDPVDIEAEALSA